MEIKKKGNKWVAVDGNGIEYTHYSEENGAYSLILSENNRGEVSHVAYMFGGRDIHYNSKVWYEKRFKPIEPPKPFWHKYEVDKPVLVRECSTKAWRKRHFAGTGIEGRPTTYFGGTTSWSVEDERLLTWNQIKDVETGEVWQVQDFL